MVRARILALGLAMSGVAVGIAPSTLPKWNDVGLHILVPPRLDAPGVLELSYKGLLEEVHSLDAAVVSSDLVVPVEPTSWRFRGAAEAGEIVRGQLGFAVRQEGPAEVALELRARWPRNGFREWLHWQRRRLSVATQHMAHNWLNDVSTEPVWTEQIFVDVRLDETVWSRDSEPRVGVHRWFVASDGSRLRWSLPPVASRVNSGRRQAVLGALSAGDLAAARGLMAGMRATEPSAETGWVIAVEGLLGMLGSDTEDRRAVRERLEAWAFRVDWSDRTHAYLQLDVAEVLALEGKWREAVTVLGGALQVHPGLWIAETRREALRRPL